MVARKGYKLTELGEIPEDWEVKPLGSLLHDFPSYGINAPAVPYDETLPVYIRITDISEDGHFLTQKRVSVCHQNSTLYLLKKWDIVFARTGASVGKTYLHQYADEKVVFAGFLIRISPDTEKVDPYYLWSHTRTNYYARWIKEQSMRSGQPGINSKQYSELQIAVPKGNRGEQTSIATALSDADALIEALELCIAKKRQIKQGTMQELLSGKRRLPGFQGKWKNVELGCLLTIAHGKNQKTVEDVNGKFPILASGGNIGNANRYIYNKPSILIGRKGTIDKPQYMDTPFWTVDTLFYSKINKNSIPKFLFYKFCTIDWYKYNEASGVPSLNAKTIERVVITIPPLDKNDEPKEQAAIATVLSDMDDEIIALEEKLAKARQIKAGMMQELLTGRIRLI